jgi:MoaA/NifB/PqqE/SkfB family radical SAM enzyme
MEKLKNFHDYVRKNNGQIGTKQRGIDLNFNNACNLTCKYCFTNSPIGDHAKDTLDLDMVASIADQADELGIFEFDLQGGELLLRPDLLFQVLEAIQPERFYLYLTTNGYFLDKEMAQRLADAKVGRVSVSIDSFDEKTHDEIRGRKESWRRAMDGLKNVQAVGIDPYLNITVGHYNAHSEYSNMDQCRLPEHSSNHPLPCAMILYALEFHHEFFHQNYQYSQKLDQL